MAASHDPAPSPPGIEKPKRFLPAFHYELISCGLRGHELIGLDAAHVRPEDAAIVREQEGVRWHRCLRCDSWLPLPPPENPTREYPPDRDHIALPIRGRPLRDAFVLRLIAVDRGLHFVILGFLSVAVFLFAANRSALQELYVRVLEAVQGGLGGPTIAAAMLWPLLIMALGYTLLFAALLMVRMRTALLAAKLRALRLAEVEREAASLMPQQQTALS